MSFLPLSKHEHLSVPPDWLDVRGWIVRTRADDQKVGRVEDILVDPDGRIHFLDVDLGVFHKHVLVPARRASPAATDEVVWIDGMTRDRLEHIPEYTLNPETLTPAFERRLREMWDAVIDDRVPTSQDGLETRYARLGGMEDYRVASADSDPRGWSVVAGDGTKIGEVKELIVDTASMSARYLDCDVDETRLDLEPVDRHVLIPTRRVRLDADDRRVVVDGIFAADLARYPVYGGLPLTRDAERSVHAVFGPWDERSDDRRAPDSAARPGEVVHVRQPDGDLRIRVAGDDVVIETRPEG